MKKLLLTLIFGFLICSCSSTKVGNDKTKYFDENNIEINESKFNQIRSTNKLLDIQGDSVNHKKLTLREDQGNVNDRKALELLLEKELNQELDSNKPIVIIYYPGKDPCNSSGTKSREWIKSWYGHLEIGLSKIAQVKPLYIYKDYDGLKKYEGILNWKKDPKGIIEKLFFKHHYPCSSFVVISKDGKYFSRFGEFGKEYVWEVTKQMNK